MRLVSTSTPVRDRISAAPPCCSPDTRPAKESVYLENNGEVLPKLRLGREQNMEANPSTHPRAVQKMWTIRKRYGGNRISFGREMPNWVTRSTTKVRVQGLYLGWWCCGETTLCRQTGTARGYSGSALLCKTRKYCHFHTKKSAEPPLHSEVPKTCKKSSARWPATT